MSLRSSELINNSYVLAECNQILSLTIEIIQPLEKGFLGLGQIKETQNNFVVTAIAEVSGVVFTLSQGCETNTECN